eukprot:5702283-Alexandrium_andersonii.AAC.1
MKRSGCNRRWPTSLPHTASPRIPGMRTAIACDWLYMAINGGRKQSPGIPGHGTKANALRSLLLERRAERLTVLLNKMPGAAPEAVLWEHLRMYCSSQPLVGAP